MDPQQEVQSGRTQQGSRLRLTGQHSSLDHGINLGDERFGVFCHGMPDADASIHTPMRSRRIRKECIFVNLREYSP